jgi:hypothetical protein
MFPLVFWGLPTAAIDRFLFGGAPPWPPERYGAAEIAAELRGRDAGADVDRDPIENRTELVELTGSAQDVAAIMRRYRLFSRQPDEMITFRALQRMNPRAGDFDPRMIQYGGAYVYMVGAGLGVAHWLGLVHLTSSVDYYLANPDAFGRFYVVARALSLIFGGLLLAGVFRLACGAGGRVAGWISFVLVACSPVFICGALEAKPHIVSAAALVWATDAALRYLRKPTLRQWIITAILAGLAFAFVLTGLVALLLVPAAAWAARVRGARWRRLGVGLAVFGAVYTVTNPYAVHHALFDRAKLMDNLGNSTAMYSVARIGSGLVRVTQLLFESGGLLPFLGIIAAIGLAARRPREWLVAALPAAALVAICVAIGADKPAEFARFMVAPVAMAAIPVAVWIRPSLRRGRWVAALVLAGCALSLRTPAYLNSFGVDRGLVNETRFAAAGYLAREIPGDAVIGLAQEPAPYSVPPLDFGRRRVVLLPTKRPEGTFSGPEWLVVTSDDQAALEEEWWWREYGVKEAFGASERSLSRITWANKPVFVLRRGSSDK